MANELFLIGILAGIAIPVTAAFLIPAADSDILQTALCKININGTVVKTCSALKDTIIFDSTKQLKMLYNTTSKELQFDVMTNSTKLSHTTLLSAAPIAWTAMPGDSTELLGLTDFRTKLDLSGYKQCRLTTAVSTVGLAGAILTPQYSVDGTNFFALGDGLNVSLDAQSLAVSAWKNIPEASKVDVTIRIMGSGGNGILSPAFNSVILQCR